METKIKEFRREQNLTQAELSAKSKVSRSIIAQLESGTREVITTDTMKKIAKALNKSVEEIFLL